MCREPLALWDVWTAIAAVPVAFEPPSAGFALDWRTLHAWRQRGVGFATLTHAAGISSTGDAALDLRAAVRRALPHPASDRGGDRRGEGGAAGASSRSAPRSCARSKSAATADGGVRAGDGVAHGRIGADTPLRVVDAILTGVHEPGESHFELLRAFADDATARPHRGGFIAERGYRTHEFGDSMLLEQQPAGHALEAIDRPLEGTSATHSD